MSFSWGKGKPLNRQIDRLSSRRRWKALVAARTHWGVRCQGWQLCRSHSGFPCDILVKFLAEESLTTNTVGSWWLIFFQRPQSCAWPQGAVLTRQSVRGCVDRSLVMHLWIYAKTNKALTLCAEMSPVRIDTTNYNGKSWHISLWVEYINKRIKISIAASGNQYIKGCASFSYNVIISQPQ